MVTEDVTQMTQRALPSPAITHMHPPIEPAQLKIIEATEKVVEIPKSKPKKKPSPPKEVDKIGKITKTVTTTTRIITEQSGENKYKPAFIRDDDWFKGWVTDRQTDEKVSLEEAIRCGLIEIDWDTGRITEIFSGKTFTTKQALDEGIIDDHITQLINTRLRKLTTRPEDRITLTATNGLLQIQIGRIRNPITNHKMTIQEAIDNGFIDADLSIILSPSRGERLTVTEAIRRGILDPQTGNVTNTSTDQVLTLSEACLEGLIPEHGLPKKKPGFSLEEAIQKGYINTETGLFTDPKTGRMYDVDQAIAEGLLYTEESKTTLAVHEKVSKKKKSRLPSKAAEEAMPLDEAFEKG